MLALSDHNLFLVFKLDKAWTLISVFESVQIASPNIYGTFSNFFHNLADF